MKHFILLSGCYADTPTAKKLTVHYGFSGKLGCSYCYLQGDNSNPTATMRFLGYDTPTAAGVLPPFADPGAGLQAFCGNKGIMLTDEMQRWRARYMVTEVFTTKKARETAARALGCHGESQLVSQLPYTSYKDLWVAPVAHASLYGVVKAFWNLLLDKGTKGVQRPWYVIPHSCRRVMTKRAADIMVTNDFNRPYRDIVTKRGLWTMEDYLHFTETFSLYILQPGDDGGHMIPHEGLREMWELLRKWVLHHLRSPAPNLSSAGIARARREAKDSLMQFSKLAESLFQPTYPLCTYNLHLMNCRFPEQQLVRGHTCYYGEWWVEQLIQLMKSSVRGRHTHRPELVAVNDMMLQEALHMVKVAEPSVKTFDEWVPEWGSGAMQGTNLDDGDREGGIGMLGCGKLLARKARADAVDVITKYVRDHAVRGWSDGVLSAAQILQYQHAYRGATREGPSMIVQSLAYTRVRTRASCYVQVTFVENRQRVDYVVAVHHFLMCCRHGAHQADALRLAVCDLHSTSRDPSTAELLVVSDLGSPSPECKRQALPVSWLKRKLLCMRVRGSQKAYFAKYDNVSNMLE